MLKGTGVQSYYAGGFVYKADKTLDYILHAEGVIRATDATGGQTLSFEYFLRDHLGNTRVVFNSSGVVLQATDYYPFGKEHTPLPISNGNRYLYNGKEKQEFKLSGSSLDWYDYGARFYDPQLGRFTTVDPLAEERQWLSPYNYCQNNPINRIDPDGALDDDYLIRDNGEIVVKETNDNFDRFYVESSQKTEGNKLIRNYSLIAQLDKSENGLVNFPESGNGFNRYGDIQQSGLQIGVKNNKPFIEFVGEGDHWLKPTTAATLFGVVNQLNKQGITLSLGDMSTSNGSDPGTPSFHHGGHGHMGKRSGLDIDFRYVGKDGNSFRGEMSNKNFDVSKNQTVYDLLFKFGFDKANTYQGTSNLLEGVKTMKGHNNHGHAGFKLNPSNIIPYKPYKL